MKIDYKNISNCLIAKKVFNSTNNEYCPSTEEFEKYNFYQNEAVALCESPIEEIMLGILLNTRKNSNIGEFINPFKISYEIKQQEKIGRYRADFVVYIALTTMKKDLEIAKYVIECDGHNFHEKTKEQASKDKRRDRLFSSKGYTVLHFTGSEIYNDPHDIYCELGSIFAQKVSNFQNENFIEYIKYVKESGAEYEK